MRERLWRAAHTLRARLTGWYLLLLSLTLILFSSYLYLRMEHSLQAQVDASLQIAASQALANLDTENGRLAFEHTENSQAVATRLSQAGFAVRLVTPAGDVWGGFGNLALPVTPSVPQVAGYATLAGDGAAWRVYSQSIVDGGGHTEGWLQTAQSLAPVQQALRGLRREVLLALPLALLVTGLGGLFLADRALRPIDRITRTAAAISGGDLSRRIAHQGPADEVGRLATTLDGMLERLQRAFARERRFTADASHELRTPLTALKGRIGVTLSRERSAAEYRSALQDSEREVDRLIRLSSDLLFLARAEERNLPPPPAALDLADLLSAAIEQVQPLADEKGLSLTGELADGLAVEGSLDHLIRLFLNLLHNAIKHTPPGGRITVRAEQDGGQVRVSVSDSGPGISPEHLPNLFERFYRTEAARSREQGGAGLGLAIAQETARWHGGTLNVESELGVGTTFTVRLPQARQAGRRQG